MRRPSLRGIPVLRTAVRLLLAFVLSLNGFLMPVAMAHHDSEPTTVSAAGCHGDSGHAASDPSAPSIGKHATGHGGKHGAPCCAHGGCQCGCLTAAGVPAIAINTTAAPDVPRCVAMTACTLASGQYTLPLRPPIA